MPYTKAQLLAALRADHPEFKAVDDEKLFAAVSIDHPDLVKGLEAPPSPEMVTAMKGLQARIPPRALPVPPEEEGLPLQLGPFKTSVQLPKFAQIPRLVNEGLGAVSAVTNQLPAGATPRPNATPELTPEQEFGANAVNTMLLGKGAVQLGKAGVRAGSRAVESFLNRPMDPTKAAIKAIKPMATNIKFAPDTEKAFPYMKAAESELGHPIETVQDWLDSVKIGKKSVWQKYAEIAGPKAQEQIYGGPIADAIEASISKKLAAQDPKAAQRIRDLANTYRKNFKLEDLDDFLTTTNAELESYYAKYPAARHAASEANPDIAQNLAEAKTLRQLIYDKLDSGTDSKDLKQTYGALKNMEKEGQRRLNVSNRQNPDSLSEQLSRWQAAAKGIKGGFQVLTGRPLEGAGNIIEATVGRQMATAVKQSNSSDAIIANLFKNYNKLPPPMRTIFPQAASTPAAVAESAPQVFPGRPGPEPAIARFPGYPRPAPPMRPPTSKIGQPLGAALTEMGKAERINNAVNTRLQEFREVVRSGATEMTGKGIRDASGKITGRHGGGIKITFPELADFPQSPGELVSAIERGKGPLYERIVKAVKTSLEVPAIDEGLFFGPADNPQRATAMDAARRFLKEKTIAK